MTIRVSPNTNKLSTRQTPTTITTTILSNCGVWSLGFFSHHSLRHQNIYQLLPLSLSNNNSNYVGHPYLCCHECFYFQLPTMFMYSVVEINDLLYYYYYYYLQQDHWPPLNLLTTVPHKYHVPYLDFQHEHSNQYSNMKIGV